MISHRHLASMSVALTLAATVTTSWPRILIAQTRLADSTQVITSGVGQVTLPPDRAIVRAGVASSGARAATASAATAAKIRVVVDSLVSLGFPRDSIRTIGWSVAPDYDAGSRRLSGYRAGATVQVGVRDLGMLGQVLDAVLGAGATGLQPITFESDSTDSGKRQALARAFADARAQGEALAAAAGGRLGRLIVVSTEAGSDLTSGVPGGLRLQAGVVLGTPINPEDVQLRATVYARWEIWRNPSR